MNKACKAHKNDVLSYLEWHTDAERRKKRVEKQLLCPLCTKWIWELLYNDVFIEAARIYTKKYADKEADND